MKEEKNKKEQKLRELLEKEITFREENQGETSGGNLVPKGKKRDSGTKIATEYYHLNTAKQDRTLFDGLDEVNIDYRNAKNEGLLMIENSLGLNLTIEGDSVLKELIKNAFLQNLDYIKSLPKIEDFNNSTIRRSLIRSEYWKTISASITLTSLSLKSTGGDRALNIEKTRKAFLEFADKSITMQDKDGRIIVFKPVTWQEISLNPRDDKEAVRIMYNIHPYLFLAIGNRYISEPESFKYILRGQNLPNMAIKLLYMLFMYCQNTEILKDGIFHINKIDLFNTIIVIPEDIKRYKKDPQRRRAAFEKTIKRFESILLLIPGKHIENGKEVEDNGYFETISDITGDPISNFRINPNFPNLLADGEIKDL